MKLAIVRKANNLVEGRYHFTIWETRVFTKMVSLIKPTDQDFKKYKIDIKEIIALLGIKDKDAYNKIKAVPESLLKKIVTIPYVDEKGQERLFKTGIIAGATIPKKGDGYIELSFHPDLKPYLLALKEKFLQYDIKNILRISSSYSVRIYELLKQYERIGQRTLGLETLKNMLGIENKYEKFGHFNSRVLKQAQKDLKEYTDICFELKLLKKGRKVYALTFFIKKNKKGAEIIQELIPKNKIIDKKLEKEFNDLLEWGLSIKKVNELILEYGKDIIKKQILKMKTILYSNNTPSITNVAGYFLELLKRNKAMISKDILRKEKIKKERLKQKDNQSKEKIKSKNIVDLKRELYNQELKVVLNLLDDTELNQKVFKYIEKKYSYKYNSDLSLKENFYADQFLRLQIKSFVEKEREADFQNIRNYFKRRLRLINDTF